MEPLNIDLGNRGGVGRHSEMFPEHFYETPDIMFFVTINYGCVHLHLSFRAELKKWDIFSILTQNPLIP